ncbi:MAG TPA: dodecin [Geminicoccaceae bacterium]|jgi:flavin-binding protein dodecin|nr:dodecin [Geminicoccaceae bacterium]
MDEHIYKIIELTGSSNDSIEAAIQNAIAKASKSLHNLRWFQVMETRGHIESGRVAHYQVTLKVGFTLDD